MAAPSDVHALTVGVLALQGAFVEHITLLQQAARALEREQKATRAGEEDGTFPPPPAPSFRFIQVRTAPQLATCDALVLPGGESTSIALIAERCGLLAPLRRFVTGAARKPVWGTCAGLILLAESADGGKESGQELIGGLDVRVRRNHFGRQVESFEADLQLPFLGPGEAPFRAVFIRAPVVERVLHDANVGGEREVGAEKEEHEEHEETVLQSAKHATKAAVEILARLPGRARAGRGQTTAGEHVDEDGDIVAVKQGNIVGTAFHPELTGDERIHAWWLGEVVRLKREGC